MKRAAALLLLVAMLALVPREVAINSAWRPPDRWNPFAALNIDDAPNLLTRYKLARLGRDPALCLSTLAGGEFRFRAVPDRSAAPGCEIRNAVRIERTSMAVSAPFTLSCPAAVSLALWERHAVQVAAEKHFGQPAVQLVHVGSYACRNVYGREAGPRSQHATANALDITGFVLKGGRRISVGKQWQANGGDDAQFLRESRDGACAFFNGVLGPDYNEDHASHLHLDRGPYRICR